jgi:two-component system, response regulator PdtaR
MEQDFKNDHSPTPTIMVVEDEPFLRFAVAEALREEGLTVVEAAGADDALRHLGTTDTVDLVFTDHRMPGTMTGAELASTIKRRWPSLPVVMTSGDFDGTEFSGILIRKPYGIYEVARKLSRIARAYRWGAGA